MNESAFQRPHLPSIVAWRGFALLVLLASLLAIGCGAESENSDDADAFRTYDPRETLDPAAVDRGKVLYWLYCRYCHGDEGEGYAADNATAVANPDFLTTATDDFLYDAVYYGRPGTTMSPWGLDQGGALTEANARDLVAYMRNWQTTLSIDVHQQVVEGNPDAGRGPYLEQCADCHGQSGEGTSQGTTLNNPWFLKEASDGFLRYGIETGRRGTEMGGFGASMTEKELNNVVALIRSWQEPANATPLQPFTPDYTNAVLNPAAADPAWTLVDGHYVTADDLSQSIIDGEKMVIVDARPRADYVMQHIEGAVSMPFYEVEAKAFEAFSKDTWIVVYCGCPHALADVAYDHLRILGYDKIVSLKEGIYIWANRRYPVRNGTSTP